MPADLHMSVVRGHHDGLASVQRGYGSGSGIDSSGVQLSRPYKRSDGGDDGNELASSPLLAVSQDGGKDVRGVIPAGPEHGHRHGQVSREESARTGPLGVKIQTALDGDGQDATAAAATTADEAGDAEAADEDWAEARRLA